jgi:hypothetical protein
MCLEDAMVLEVSTIEKDTVEFIAISVGELQVRCLGFWINVAGFLKNSSCHATLKREYLTTEC